MPQYQKDMDRLDMLFGIAQSIEPVAHARVTASLYVKNELISLGWCQLKSSPFALKYGANSQSLYIHAETSAIKQALRRFSVDDLAKLKTTLYVARAKRGGAGTDYIWGMSKPCEGCLRSIVDFGIKRVVYTLDASPLTQEKFFGELP